MLQMKGGECAVAQGPPFYPLEERVPHGDRGRCLRGAGVQSVSGCVKGSEHSDGEGCAFRGTGIAVQGPFKEFGLYPEASGGL